MTSKEDIRNAAYVLFALDGFSEATTEKIANALGLKKQSLYSHYKSKNDIIVDVIEKQEAFIIDALETTFQELKSESTEVLLRGVFVKIIEIFTDKMRLLLWKRTYIGLNNEELAEIIKKADLSFEKVLFLDLYQIIAPRHPRLKDETSFRLLFGTYFMIIQGYLDWMLLYGNNPDSFEAIWSSIWNGVKTTVE